MEGTVEFFLNVAMVVLLSATVFYCFILNKRIKLLQDSKGELATLLKKFDLSTKRASQTMVILQKASQEAGKNVQNRIEKAQYMLDDLSYMIDKANKLADQMEAGIAIARQREKIIAQEVANDVPAKTTKKKETPSSKVVTPTEVITSKSLAEFEETSVSDMATEMAYSDEMIELKNTQVKSRKKSSQPSEELSQEAILQSLRDAKAGGKNSKAAVSLQSLIERVAERTQVVDDKNEDDIPADLRSMVAAAPTSRSERELLKALEMQAE